MERETSTAMIKPSSAPAAVLPGRSPTTSANARMPRRYAARHRGSVWGMVHSCFSRCINFCSPLRGCSRSPVGMLLRVWTKAITASISSGIIEAHSRAPLLVAAIRVGNCLWGAMRQTQVRLACQANAVIRFCNVHRVCCLVRLLHRVRRLATNGWRVFVGVHTCSALMF